MNNKDIGSGDKNQQGGIGEKKNIEEFLSLYRQLNFNLIPLKKGKEPGGTWKIYQSEKTTQDERKKWFIKESNNVGILCGSISDNLMVIDVDAPELLEVIFPEIEKLKKQTLVVKTPHGFHIYFRTKKAFRHRDFIRKEERKPLVEIRGEGNLVVAPPSKVEGREYLFISETNGIAEIPESQEISEERIESALVKAGIELKKSKVYDPDELLQLRMKEGEGRNNTALILATYLRKQGLSEEEAGEKLKGWNSDHIEPLDEKELLQTIQSAYKPARPYEFKFKKVREERRGYNNGANQSEVIIQLVRDKAEFFHNQYHEPYARISVEEHFEVWSLKSRQFKRWLSKILWEAKQEAAGSEATNVALNVLESIAYFDGPQIELQNRVVLINNEIYYDLTNEEWEAIRISADGWSIVRNPDSMFRRYAHQISQTRPGKSGDITKILKYLNLRNDDDKLLTLVYIVNCLVPDIPHLIPILHGPQGSAKSTYFKVIRSLVDPSSLLIITFPKDKNELVQKLSHHYCAFFDNVTKLSDWQSDTLCRASTGEGYSKRELYSDDEDVIYSYRRCVSLNGINIAAHKPDLLDRGMLIELERIPENRRMTEKEFWEKFNKDKPDILAGILDALSKAMKIKEGLKINRLPRMADVAEWGEAIAQAMGYGEYVFLQAYMRRLGEQNKETIEGHSIGPAIMDIMTERNEWEGTPTELLDELRQRA
ncbi:MAG: bifunctional DNA primase/polymerase, partial [Candidatus Altiarchaeota archaeon]|nr:bifunctional DNA primase/polymerase [Candidatus Altiarchaeota archaeon]